MPDQIDHLSANPKLDFVEDELSIFEGVTVRSHPAAVVFGVGLPVQAGSLTDAHAVESGHDAGLGDAEMSRGLGGGEILFYVKFPDLVVIEEFRGQRELNEINKIRRVSPYSG